VVSGWAARPPKSWADPNANTYEWRKFRAQWLKNNPWCYLRIPGKCLIKATLVDHKDNCDYTINRCNPEWIAGSACAPCHAVRTAEQGNRARKRLHLPRATPSRNWPTP
jgi:hypothetical protein